MTLIHPFHEILLPLRIIPAVVSKTCFSRTSQKSGGHNLLYSMSDMLLSPGGWFAVSLSFFQKDHMQTFSVATSQNLTIKI